MIKLSCLDTSVLTFSSDTVDLDKFSPWLEVKFRIMRGSVQGIHGTILRRFLSNQNDDKLAIITK